MAEEVGRFVFGIRNMIHQNKKSTFQTEIANTGVPSEIVIMQMKAWLKLFEKEYYNNF